MMGDAGKALIPGRDLGACPDCGGWRKAGMAHDCDEHRDEQKAFADKVVALGLGDTGMSTKKKALARVADKIARLETQLAVARMERDRLAAELIQKDGCTWREVAALADFENPYIAQVLRKARA